MTAAALLTQFRGVLPQGELPQLMLHMLTCLLHMCARADMPACELRTRRKLYMLLRLLTLGIWSVWHNANTAMLPPASMHFPWHSGYDDNTLTDPYDRISTILT